MEEGFGKLQSDVEHIQTDIAGVKTEAHITNAKIDDARKEVSVLVSSARTEFNHRLDNADQHTEAVRVGLAEKLDACKDTLFKLSRDGTEQVERMRTEVLAQTERVRLELSEKVDDLRNRLDILRAEMLQKFEKVDLRLQLVQSELTRQIDQVKESGHTTKESVHRAKMQNLLWCISLAVAFFYILARVFKWF